MTITRGTAHTALRAAVLLAALSTTSCSTRDQGPIARESGPERVEGGVVFRYYDQDAKKVCLVGDFNNWSPLADPMKDMNGDGHWSLYYPLQPGTYRYKFVVDGRWVPDSSNPDSEPDGFDGINSVVRVLAASGP